MNRIKIAFFFLALFAMGCSPYESIVNFKENVDYPLSEQSIVNYEPVKFQPGDILRIEVSSTEAEAVTVFNNYQTSGFLVGADGAIEFPLAGKVQLEGKTADEAKEELLESIKKYFIVAPTINVVLSNFTVTVNGEVGAPGTVGVQNDRISIIEAISQSGDFTGYSMRDSVMVVREHGGTRSFGYVNFNSSEVFQSPYFYLKQNDVVYVRPEKRLLGTIRTRQDKLLPYVSVAISVILLSLTISRSR